MLNNVTVIMEQQLYNDYKIILKQFYGPFNVIEAIILNLDKTLFIYTYFPRYRQVIRHANQASGVPGCDGSVGIVTYLSTS